MALRLGDTVPDFTQDSQLGPIHLSCDWSCGYGSRAGEWN